jgi:WD40 repeat protein
MSNMLVPEKVQLGKDIVGDFDDERSGRSGRSVSLSGDGRIVAIGATMHGGGKGMVRIYERDETGASVVGWKQLGQDIPGEKTGDQTGFSVSLNNDGDIIAIGSPWGGYVCIYGYGYTTAGEWGLVGDKIEGDGEDAFGFSVSLSGNGQYIAIGATENKDEVTQSIHSGYVRIYMRDAEGWKPVGDAIKGESANDKSGTSVSLSHDGSIVAIGATSGKKAGYVRIYERIADYWVQIGKNIFGDNTNGKTGSSVSLSGSGTIVAIGAPKNNANTGRVRIYERDINEKLLGWKLIGEDIDGDQEDIHSGHSVSLSGNGEMVAIGTKNLGSVRVYARSERGWKLWTEIIRSHEQGSIKSVSLNNDGSIIAIGDPEVSKAGPGNVSIYNLDSDRIHIKRLYRNIGAIEMKLDRETDAIDMKLTENLDDVVANVVETIDAVELRLDGIIVNAIDDNEELTIKADDNTVALVYMTITFGLLLVGMVTYLNMRVKHK